MKPVGVLIVGAGSRGRVYASYALAHPEQVRVVGVAEPRPFFRQQMAEAHNPAPANVVADWRELAERPKLADAVIIATPDHLHHEPALAFAAKGYDILLEKPMAPHADSCRMIAEAAVEQGVLLAVSHVLRYTDYTRRFRQIIESGLIGEIVSIQHLEPVGYWHYVHSYVRGNWRNEAESSFMLLAKSCHDLDWLRYIVGQPCVQVSSFGSLNHFRRENKFAMAGAATNCLNCAYEPSCPYSAKRFYLDLARRGQTGWPLDVVTTDFSESGVLTALANGPYGRCVYECDNDVVDHQVVNLLYQNGVTASFTMIGTSGYRDRETIVFGTRGELRGNGHRLTRYDFLSDKTEDIPIESPGLPAPLSGHGGGDYRLMQHFVQAVSKHDPALILSGPNESLETHLTAFAAERARKENRVVRLDSFNS